MIEVNGGIQMIKDQDSNEIKEVQLNNFELIPEQVVMQNLAHFFLSPTGKSLPYSFYFNDHPNWFIYSLTYLYSFIRSAYHSSYTNKIFSKMVIKTSNESQICPETITHIITQLVKSQQKISSINRKVLLTRYMSIPSCIAEYLAKNKSNTQLIQKFIIGEVSTSLRKLTLDEQIFIINKITMLGHFRIVIERCMSSQGNLQLIIQLYPYIVRKDTVLSTLLKIVLQKESRSMDKKILQRQFQQLLQKYHNTPQNHSQIASLLQQQYLQPAHTQIIYRLLLTKNQSLKAFIFEDLLVWWTQSNDNYFIYNMIKFRTNLLAMILQSLDKIKLIQYCALISYGIQKRLMNVNQNRKEVVNLVWSVLAHKMGFQLPKQFNKDLLKSDIIEVQQEYKEEKQKLTEIIAEKKENKSDEEQKKLEKNNQQKQKQQNYEIKIKPPRNLYDCILGLQNPARKQITLELMPKLIRKNPDDIVFLWRDLIQNLMYNLNEDTKPSIVALFVTRSQPFIQSVGQVFFTKDHSLNDKIVLIEALCEGVQQLSTKPTLTDEQQPKEQFYFKKVTSKYYNQKDKNKNDRLLQEKDESKSRRWGHTRIAHQKKFKQKQSGVVSLKIVENQPYINRLYEISNQLYFRIISRLSLLPIFPKQPMFTTPMMKLLATLSYNLKNHIEKYKILTQIVDICVFVIEHMQSLNKKLKTEESLKNAVKWKNTNLSILNTLNKVSLVIDKFIPTRMLQNLQKCTTKLKNSKQYGINPVINMIEANIYTNVSGGNMPF